MAASAVTNIQAKLYTHKGMQLQLRKSYASSLQLFFLQNITDQRLKKKYGQVSSGCGLL